MGIDFTAASIELLKRRYGDGPGIKMAFRTADLTDPLLDLGEKFDLINVMNVLFHIPEADRFAAAMKNLSNHLAPGGRIVTSEYMPRGSMRTNWMLVRSRYEKESAAAAVGLRIAAIRASCVYGNDPMGIDGPDAGLRQQFNAVRSGMNQILAMQMNEQLRQFFTRFLTDVELSVLNFCKERMAEVDIPSQKLVVLAAASAGGWHQCKLASFSTTVKRAWVPSFPCPAAWAAVKSWWARLAAGRDMLDSQADCKINFKSFC